MDVRNPPLTVDVAVAVFPLGGAEIVTSGAAVDDRDGSDIAVGHGGGGGSETLIKQVRRVRIYAELRLGGAVRQQAGERGMEKKAEGGHGEIRVGWQDSGYWAAPLFWAEIGSVAIFAPNKRCSIASRRASRA